MLGITPAPRHGLPEYGNPAQERGRFSPYNDNGGTTVAIAGEDFAVVASDTRLTDGRYGILSRGQGKLFELTGRCVLAASGCWADVLTLTRLAQARIQTFRYTHNQTIGTSEAAQMLSNMLYGKRFFPYYVHNVLAGLDAEGRGVVYSYDPVGCVEKLVHAAGGAGVALIQPLLDNQVDRLNMKDVGDKRMLSLEEAEKLAHDCFVSAAEREIGIGDGVHFKIVTKDGIADKVVELRRD